MRRLFEESIRRKGCTWRAIDSNRHDTRFEYIDCIEMLMSLVLQSGFSESEAYGPFPLVIELRSKTGK